MSDSYSEWQQGNEYYHSFYQMEGAYHLAMANDPPNVRIAFRVLRQMYNRTAFAFAKKKRESLDKKFLGIRELLFEESFSKYSFVPAVQRRMRDQQQRAIDLLGECQRELYDAMHEKKMLLPFGSSRRSGYGSIGPGGMVD
jgi:hypothetical protein